jgi:Na+-driven multidrug efflux pump
VKNCKNDARVISWNISNVRKSKDFDVWILGHDFVLTIFITNIFLSSLSATRLPFPRYKMLDRQCYLLFWGLAFGIHEILAFQNSDCTTSLLFSRRKYLLSLSSSSSLWHHHTIRIPKTILQQTKTNSNEFDNENDDTELSASSTSSSASKTTSTASKRDMMAFAIPALGIFLMNPLLSNIDNAFVGRTVGAVGLAALSPATICTDQALYLFSFLSRATTGLVARAYYRNSNDNNDDDNDDNTGNKSSARAAASAPLVVSIVCGLFLSILYAVGTPSMLRAMKVDPSILPSAASYIYWRGAISWAALAQACALQIFLATKDVMTPLVIVAMSAILNIVGDYLFCQWPFRWGCSGAAAATALATLVSSGTMIVALQRQKLLPSIRKLPTREELKRLSEFTGPLLAITITRLISFVAMQRRAMTLGLQPLAAYQFCINVVMFFLLFAEPLSQLSQTTLPSLVDSDDGNGVVANLKSILTLGIATSFTIGAVAYMVTRFLTGMVTNDWTVISMAQSASPAVFLVVSQAILAITLDGAMLASREFGFLLLVGTMTCLLQMGTLQWCNSIGAILSTFSLRLGSYSVAVIIRLALGKGTLGKTLRKVWRTKKGSKEAPRLDLA